MEWADPIVANAGREEELGAILREFERVPGGSARRVIVSGPKGIGKTWLLDAAQRAFASRGVPVAQARASRGRTIALGFVRDLSRSLIELAEAQGLRGAELAILARRMRGLLENGEPETRGVGSAPEELVAARLRQVEALAELLSEVGKRGAVVLLDELDALDPGSRDVIGAVMAGLGAPGVGAGLLIVAAWREPPEEVELSERFHELPGASIKLGSLDVAGIRSFLDRAKIPERLLAQTAGIPSRIEEMLLPRPPDLAQRRLAQLQPVPRRCLLVAALLGRPASSSLLLAATGAEARQDHLDALVEGRFLGMRLASGEPLYELARDDDRLRLLEGSSFEERCQLHLAIASLLETLGADVEEIARHYLAGDPVGLGVDWAVRAADGLAARHAYGGAADLYREALAHGGTAGLGFSDERAASLHLRLSEVLEVSGDPIGALRHLGLARRGSGEAAARAIRARAARICGAIGRSAQALRLANRVLGGEGVFLPDDPAGAAAFAALCDARFLQGEYEEAIAACEAGIAASGDDVSTRLLLRNTLGKAYLNLGAYEEASRAFAKNVEEADAAGSVREQVRALVNEGVVAHRLGARRTAFERYRAARDLGADPLLDALAVGNLGALHHEVGEFEEAVAMYGQAIAAFVRGGRRKEASHHSLNFARLMRFLGDLDAASAHAAFARREASAVGDPYLVAQADMITGEILLERNEPYRAEAIFTIARESFAAVGNRRYQAEVGLFLGRVHLVRGDRKAARAELERVRSEAPPKSDSLDVEIELLEAELALAEGDRPASRRLLEHARPRLLTRVEGVGGASDLSAPWRTHALLSRLREAEGDRGGAEADRLRALRLVEDQAARVPEHLRARFLEQARRSLGAPREEELSPELAAQVRQLDGGVDAAPIVGDSRAMRRLRLSLGPIARSLAPVLIRGETGTGRELVADAIHRGSPRRDRPYVKVHAGASDEESLFAQLFGAEGGGAGALQQARGGTVFLDDLGALSVAGQLALARLLGQQEYRRVGSDQVMRADARLIVSTACDLDALLASRNLRRELYDELEAVTVELPALRERIEDVPALADVFLARVCAERGGPAKRFSPEALDLLQAWTWPGNVRELENLVMAVSIFAPGDLVDLEAFERYGKFPPPARPEETATAPVPTRERKAKAGQPAPPSGPLDFYALAKARGIGIRELQGEIENQMIARALQEAQGNISEAARLLQMKRSRLSQIVNGEPSLRKLTRAAS
ncbi:MAG TPA: sigma 54-interacting transcriptional regulator [Vulgatibacter sp.]